MLIDLITSCRKSTAIYAFVDMGLSVHFKDGACVNISELSCQYGLDHSRFSRLCEYLIKIGYWLAAMRELHFLRNAVHLPILKVWNH